MLHDKKNRAFVQEAQQDKTSYSQARLQRGQTEGRNYALYTRDTSSQHQQTQCWPMTKAVLTFPVVFSKALWHTAHFNEKCLIYITLSFMQLSTLWCWWPDMVYIYMVHGMKNIQDTQMAQYALQTSTTYAQTAHWLNAITHSRGVWGWGWELVYTAATAIHSQQYESLQPWPAVIINSIVYKHSIRCKQLS